MTATAVNRRYFPNNRNTLRKWKVLVAGFLAGPDNGLTYEELDSITGFVYGANTLPTQLGAMAKAGLIHKTGMHKGKTLWTITDAGYEWAQTEGKLDKSITPLHNFQLKSDILEEHLNDLLDAALVSALTFDFVDEWVERLRLALEEGIQWISANTIGIYSNTTAKHTITVAQNVEAHYYIRTNRRGKFEDGK